MLPNKALQSDGPKQTLTAYPGSAKCIDITQDTDLSGLYLHQLRGKYRGRWSVHVSGNWRVTFKFDGPDAVDVDYEHA